MSKKSPSFFLLERIPRAPFFHFCLADSILVNKYFKSIHHLKTNPGDTLDIFENDDFLYYYRLEDLRVCTNEIFNKIISNPEWGIKTDELTLNNAHKFFVFSQKLEKINLKNTSDKDLAKLGAEWFKGLHNTWCAGWPIVLVDFEKNLFSNHLNNYLKQKIQANKLKISVGDVFSILTTPTTETFAQKETIDLLKLLQKIKQNKKLVNFLLRNDLQKVISTWQLVDKKSWLALKNHYEKYCWLPFMYMGPEWGIDYFVDSLIRLLQQKTNPEEELKKIANKKQEIIRAQKNYIKDLEIRSEFQELFKLAQRFVYSKSYRKDVQYYSCYVLQKLLREVARRQQLSMSQINRLYSWELKNLLKNKGPNEHILNERIFAVQFSTTKTRVTYEGKKAKDFVKQIKFIKQKTEKVNQLVGDCASVGKVRGIVKIINSPKEINKMEKGNVLVSYATSPDIMPAIKKAVAIVTDLGGIICHAAIVSRELYIPCVVGTKMATQVLKDGDLVEVDASHGIVRKLSC
ncbi:MAG: Phosphoenolpyruvate synthase/pyruvate phosphate dikinase [Candidatus Magasanikbacteria bacterium GW2011_GWC2_37_14]|uniref:Phosphoenolpyruvate synthase/pyruvate phosphate dikinase n=1 Tax=Candidatus Magasanikbacteria bacterium GW2011_GWC2_37_14 TaxID=1619046 RepID=A0A0G0JJD7_9BACT|nr:MAG: Phosphoenolpyruvate synthase/pyruvate phosphate dikinase [Candidatus Magasanikbacteria bacterium GW2011_GWC2_37_14]